MQEDDPVPFAFHLAVTSEAPVGGTNAQPTRIAIAKSISEDVLDHPIHSDNFSPEDIFVIHCAPQSVFKVRPATRCSSTLSG